MTEVEELRKQVLINAQQNLEHHNKYFKFSQTIVTSINNIDHDINDIKKYQMKYNYVNLAIVFLAGLILGISINTWKPYAKDIYGAFQVAKEITHKGGGQ